MHAGIRAPTTASLVGGGGGGGGGGGEGETLKAGARGQHGQIKAGLQYRPGQKRIKKPTVNMVNSWCLLYTGNVTTVV